MHNYKVGDKVRFTDERLHIVSPDIYPPEGTVGTVLDVDKTHSDEVLLYVQWAERSTSHDDRWWTLDCRVEAVPKIKRRKRRT